MQKFHYTNGTNSFGPFSIEELKDRNITGDTYVWTDGMPSWVLAKTIPELESVIVADKQPYFSASAGVPPEFSQTPVQNKHSDNSLVRPPKNYLIETILTTIFCCWPLGIPSIIYATRVEKKFYKGDVNGAELDSASAKKWMIINIIACVVLWVFYAVVLMLGFLTS